MNEYNNLELIGSGSFSKVYKAFHIKKKKNYCVKEFYIDIDNISDEDSYRILTEIKILSLSNYCFSFCNHFKIS